MMKALKLLTAGLLATLAGTSTQASDLRTWEGWTSGAPAELAASAPLTAKASLPTTGSATYSGVVVGAENRGGDRGVITGTTALTADFANRTLTGSFDNLRRPFGGANLAGSTTPVNAQVNASWGAGNNIIGSVTAATSNGSMTGTVNAAFFGFLSPTANVAGAWNLAGANTTAAGIFAARRR